LSDAELALLARVAVGFALGFIVGFERQVRGSPAGDRTFALVGAASAAITAVSAHFSPQAIAGVVTGVGFIGGAVVLHRQGGAVITGITTAATIFAAAAIGIVVGFGHLILGAITAVAVLVLLELQHIPGLKRLDAANYENRFSNDRSYPQYPPAPTGPDTADGPPQ
jgi:putative Mg2+ transporter-C (MgtC) family protein